MNPAAQFARGLAVPFKGFAIVITSFPLFFLAVTPFWLWLFAAVFGFYYFFSNSQMFYSLVLQWVPGLFDLTQKIKFGEFFIFDAILQGFFWLFVILFLSYFSYLLLSVVGAPFYSLLADRIVTRKGVQLPIENNWLRWLYTSLKMFMINAMKLVLFSVIAAICLVFSFFPLGMVLVPLFMALLIAYDCMDFTLECGQYSIVNRWRFFRRHFLFFAGLALTILIVGFVPGLFTLTLPFFIAGSADLFADIQSKGLLKGPT